MEILINILIFLHILGLVIGMGSGVALSRLGPFYGQISEDQRGVLFKFAFLLGRNGHIGLGLLWVTGILVVWLKYGGVADFSWWFWAKMVLVVILSASIGMGSAAFRKFAAGDMGASARAAMAGKINAVAGVLIILSAVFAFG